MSSTTPPTPLDAPAHILALLARLHRRSLEQESRLSPTGKVFSATVLGDLAAAPPEASRGGAAAPATPSSPSSSAAAAAASETAAARFDALMRDKFIALDADKCQFTYQLLRAMGATQVVEAGTSFGVSTIYLALAVAANAEAAAAAAAAAASDAGAPGGKVSGRVIATEKEAEKAAVARDYWRQCGPVVAEQIELRVGDLLETLKTDLPVVDLLLLDIWSALALPTLKTVLPRLRHGAVVLTDNTISGADGYRDLLAFLRDPENGFHNMTLPFTNGFEMSVYTPKAR